MKYAVAVFLILSLAGSSWGNDPGQTQSHEVIQPPALGEGTLHCQPPGRNFRSLNASTPFGSEVVDDIPEAFSGVPIAGISFYILQWFVPEPSDAWSDPSGIIINLYNEDCPPPEVPYDSMYFSWANPQMLLMPVGSSSYQVTQFFESPLVLATPTSVGFQVDIPWGQEQPYVGITATEDSDVYGCGQGYWDGEAFGHPRWTPISAILPAQCDVAYCLMAGGSTATRSTTWSLVKSIYK